VRLVESSATKVTRRIFHIAPVYRFTTILFVYMLHVCVTAWGTNACYIREHKDPLPAHVQRNSSITLATEVRSSAVTASSQLRVTSNYATTECQNSAGAQPWRRTAKILSYKCSTRITIVATYKYITITLTHLPFTHQPVPLLGLAYSSPVSRLEMSFQLLIMQRNR